MWGYKLLKVDYTFIIDHCIIVTHGIYLLASEWFPFPQAQGCVTTGSGGGIWDRITPVSSIVDMKVILSSVTNGQASLHRLNFFSILILIKTGICVG